LRLKDLDVDRWTLRRNRGRVRLVDADPAGIQEIVVPQPLCEGNGPGGNAHSATSYRTRSRFAAMCDSGSSDGERRRTIRPRDLLFLAAPRRFKDCGIRWRELNPTPKSRHRST